MNKLRKKLANNKAILLNRQASINTTEMTVLVIFVVVIASAVILAFKSLLGKGENDNKVLDNMKNVFEKNQG